METYNYTPVKGQLCQVYKGFDNVYSVEDNIKCFIPDPLIEGEIIIITKVTYQEEMGSFYIEYLRGGKLYYSYFYEQVIYFEQDWDGQVQKKDEKITTFDFPWVLCER
tara:strand:+ start:24 stop:347 length:324 start_codon:yes stop_codon:yes gene_type:complete